MKKQRNEFVVDYVCGCTLTLVPRFKGILRIDWKNCKEGHELQANPQPLVLTKTSRKSLQVMAEAIFHVLSLRRSTGSIDKSQFVQAKEPNHGVPGVQGFKSCDGERD